jgi:hypothetical protein
MNEKLRRPTQALFFTLVTLFLSLTTVIAASIPLLILRREFGRWHYLALTVLMVVGLALGQQLEGAFALLSIVLLVLVYVEARDLGLAHLYSGALSVLFVVGSLYCGGHFWLRSQGSSLRVFFLDKIEVLSKQLQAMDPNLKLEPQVLVSQIPSAAIIALAVSIWLAMLWDGRLKDKSGLEQELVQETDHKTGHEIGLSDFRVPDWFVWIFLGSAVGSLFDLEADFIKVAATNVLNLSVLLYFFQGMAIVGVFFKKQKMGPLWQALGYFILIAQLFLFVAILGFVDLWIDFRAKMLKKSEQRTGEV